MAEPDSNPNSRAAASPQARAAILLGVSAGLALVAWMLIGQRDRPSIEPGMAPLLSSASPYVNTSPAVAFVGSERCLRCHEEQADSYAETAHSRALTEVNPADEPPDAVFDHPASHRRYHVERRDGRLLHRESLLVGESEEVDMCAHPAKYRLGTGRFGRTYLCEAEGYLVESPVSWYTPRERWDVSPGYDAPQHDSFTRFIPRGCLECHAGQVVSENGNDYRPRIREHAIGCERCHGPGALHIRREEGPGTESGEPDLTIVNPRRLSRELSESVCNQCHLQGDITVVARGRRDTDFRPGLPLEEFRHEYRLAPATADGMTIAGHAEQLHRSACYQNSATLTCVTCHDPHRPVDPAEQPDRSRATCLQCHADRGCRLPVARRIEQASDHCVRCHMPSSETEIPHVAFTHHRIGIHQPAEKHVGQARDRGDAPDVLLSLQDLSRFDEFDIRRSVGLAHVESYRRLVNAFEDPREVPDFRVAEELLRGLSPAFVDAPVLAGLAQLDFQAGREQSAEDLARRILKCSPIGINDRCVALTVLAELARKRQQPRQARELYGELATLRRDARDLLYLGISENNCGRTDEAIRRLEESMAVDPFQPEPHEALAVIYQGRGETAQARRHRQRALLLKTVQPVAPPAGRFPPDLRPSATP